VTAPACLEAAAGFVNTVGALIALYNVYKLEDIPGPANDPDYGECSTEPGQLCKNVGQYLLRRYTPFDIEYDPARPGLAEYRCDYKCPNGAKFTKYFAIREGFGGCPAELPYSP
jgi:hypothetical protein